MTRPLRLSLVILALGGILWALLDHARITAEKRALVTELGLGLGLDLGPASEARAQREELRALDALSPGLSRRIESEIDPGVAALVLARSTVSAYLDPERRLAAAAGATQESTLDALERARELSTATLVDRPTSWQASMLLGATTYLIRLRERDTRLFSAARDWEEPLETAHRLAPGQIEPRRFLAAAYLDTWPALSPPKRTVARELVADLLADRESFRLLIGAWLRIAADPSHGEEAFDLIPAEPWAWSYLLDALAGSRDWERYTEARDRWHSALAGSLRATVEEASERLAGGDLDGAKSRLHSVISQTPVSSEYAEIFSDALRRLPPGPVATVAERGLRRWYDWTLRQCATVECPLAPAVVSRLAGAVRDALPHEAAAAALAAEDRSTAEAIERRNQVDLEETWADYLLYKSAWLLESGDLSAAESTRDRVHRSRHGTPRWEQLALRLERASEASSRPDGSIGPTAWPAEAWREHSDGLALELLPTRTADGISLRIPGSLGGGAAEVLWDGRRVGTYVVGGATAIDLDVEVTPDLHLLEIVPITGARPRPGRVELVSRTR